MKTVRRKIVDRSLEGLLPIAYEARQELVWDRYEKMQPQCGFGELGLSCRFCLQGPCRIDPFGAKAGAGICGRTDLEMAAGGLLEMTGRGLAVRLEELNGLLAQLPSGSPAAAAAREFIAGTGACLSARLSPKLSTTLRQRNLLHDSSHALMTKVAAALSGPGRQDARATMNLALQTGLASVLTESVIQQCREELFGVEVILTGEVGMDAFQLSPVNILTVGEFPVRFLNELLSATGEGISVFGVANHCPKILPISPEAAAELLAFTDRISVAVFSENYEGHPLRALLTERGVTVLNARESPVRQVVQAAMERHKPGRVYDPRSIYQVTFHFGLGMIDKLAASAPQGLVLFAGEANARATIGGATEEWLNECKRRGLTTLTFGETAVIAAGSGAQATATLADQAGAAALYLLNKGHEVLVVYPEITRAESVAQAIGCAAMGLNVLVGQALPFWLTGGLNLLCAEALAGGRLLADPQGLRAAEALATAVHSGQEA